MRVNIPIQEWTRIIGSKMPMFASKNRIYRPSTIYIKMTEDVTDPEGTVKIQVPVFDDAWYSTVTDVVGEMVHVENVDIVDYKGNSISGLSRLQLGRVGELTIINANTGDPVYVATVVAPPKRVCSTKQRDISEWFDGTKDLLCKKIVQQLQTCDFNSLAAVVSQTGPLRKMIKSHLIDSSPQNMPWTEFLKTFAQDNVARNLDSTNVANAVSDAILSEIKKGLRANKHQIETYYAHKSGDASNLWGGKNKSKQNSMFSSDLEMYQDITDEAIYRPCLDSRVCRIINMGESVCQSKTVPISRKIRASNVKDPLDEYFHGDYFKRFGKLPAHVTRKIASKYGKDKENKPYPGNANVAREMYNLFSGRHAYPTIGKPMPRLVSRTISEMPRLGSRKPRLIPISSKPMPESMQLDISDNYDDGIFVDNFANI